MSGAPVFDKRYKLQQYTRTAWRDVAAADSREEIEKIRKRLIFPELYRVIDTQEEGKDER